jgi:multicomponent Na+:H+ antiporter subunit E
MTEPRPETSGAAWRRVPQAVLVALLGLGAWTALTGGEPASLVVGLPAVALATAASLRAEAAPPGNPSALVRFVPFFLREILASAWYVAARVFRRRLDLDPGLVTYRLRLEGQPARAAFMNAVTLTPGTLSADLRGDRLDVHALDRRGDPRASLAALEARIARLFDQPLAEDRP